MSSFSLEYLDSIGVCSEYSRFTTLTGPEDEESDPLPARRNKDSRFASGTTRRSRLSENVGSTVATVETADEAIVTICCEPTHVVTKLQIGKLELAQSPGCWVSVGYASSALAAYGESSFDELFSMHPEEKGKIRRCRTTFESQRWFESYLETPKDDPALMPNYMFSDGNACTFRPLPLEFQPFLDYMNARRASKPAYNQVVVNWYQDGSDFTPFHSDCLVGMVEGADIAVLTLCPKDTAPRKFMVRKIFPPVLPQDVSVFHSHVEIDTIHGQIVTMGAESNKSFKHGVPRMPEPTVGRRISLSFRSYHM